MAITSFPNGSPVAPFPVAADLQQFEEPSGEKYFDEQNPLAKDRNVAHIRARTFLNSLVTTLRTQEEHKSPLQTLLEQSLQFPYSEENKQILAKAFFKQRGYLSRLFSKETWEEWTDNRTVLGKVASQFRDCMQSKIEVSCFTKRLDEQVIHEANEEAKALHKRLDNRKSPSFSTQTKSSCTSGVFVGTVGSLLTNNPFPLLLGLSECFPRVRAQQKVGSEFQVNTFTSGLQMRPSVATLPNNNFVVTYGSDEGSFGVRGQLFNETGAKIGSEFPVNTYIPDDQKSPAVSSLKNGNFVIVWQSFNQDGSDWGEYGQIFNGTGAKIGSEFQVNTGTTNEQADGSVASLIDGNFVVVWHSSHQGSFGIYGQLFNETGGKIGNEFLVNTYTPNEQKLPSIASLNSGDFVVAWESQRQDGSLGGIYAQLFNRTASRIGNEFQVNSYTTNQQGGPSVASLLNGNFVVTWYSNLQDGDSEGIYGQIFDGSGNKIGSEFQVNTFTTDQQGGVSVIGLSNNHFIVTWQSFTQDGSDWGVYGQLFDANGSKLGNEFPINTNTAYDQSQPSVASFQNENFVVTWHSDRQDGSFYGIYGQIFHNNFTSPSSSTSSFTSTFSSSTSFNTSSSTQTSTSTTTSSIFSTTIPDITTNAIPPFSPPNNRLLWLWVLLGITSGTTCIGIPGYFCLKRRSREKDPSLELGQANLEFPNTPIDPPTPPRITSEYLSPKRSEKSHTRIGDKYDLINKISREEAEALAEQTGINVVFPPGVNRTKVLFGKGNFGKIRLARNVKNGLFFAVKKIKGSKQIAQSREEGALQKKLKGLSNIMPISNFVESVDSNGEPVLYQFMPLAGFGNGEELRNHLKGLRDSIRKEQILLHVAKGLLTGFSHMHQVHIYHSDMKPANMVLDMQGEVYIIDFGCAKELPSGLINERMTGDTRYFSPERIAFYRQIRDDLQPDPIAADKVDAWSLGVSLLELATGDYPFDRTRFSEKVERWDNAYFEQTLDTIPSLKYPEPDSIMTVVKGLLDIDPQRRLSIKDALAQLAHRTPFSSLSEQIATFADLKQQEPPSTHPQDAHLPRNQDENYEHVFAQRFGYKLTPDFASHPTTPSDDFAGYT